MTVRTGILLAACLAAGTQAAAAAPNALERAIAQATEYRHQIHRNPELGNREFATAKLVAEHLRKLGLEVETGVAHTGVIGILRGGKPGPVVAVRADMDALPVTENSGLPFASTKKTEYLGQTVGVAHACGHDVHTAVQLGVAQYLAARRETLSGTVLFIFQPAEEGAPEGEEGGAALMLKEGVFDELTPDAIFALHAFPDFQVGEVGFTSGPAYASSDQFFIKLKGKQAHGAWPHLSVDPVLMAAETVQALQSIRSRNMDPSAPGVVTVGIIRGGERHNIIPETVELHGTARAYDETVQELMEKRIGEIVGGIAQAHGGDFDYEYRRGYPATINDAGLSAWARRSLENSVGADNVRNAKPVMGAEDFSFFANEVPGFYFRLGVVKPGTESGALHTPTFRADDGAIPVGIRAMAGLVTDYLQQQPGAP